MNNKRKAKKQKKYIKQYIYIVIIILYTQYIVCTVIL